ncbi:related to glyoxal oxidase precursor [Rhynchosporium graminicola]|uniref:Related to glyoxal oxidase n=1 Tax=Rhynchosporium graminicola TaxID=2792576 RepID=A0A1E1LN66_9HELO|nr:related to glyoxal oxidase precursor [Rhynchosporium commune]
MAVYAVNIVPRLESVFLETIEILPITCHSALRFMACNPEMLPTQRMASAVLHTEIRSVIQTARCILAYAARNTALVEIPLVIAVLAVYLVVLLLQQVLVRDQDLTDNVVLKLAAQSVIRRGRLEVVALSTVSNNCQNGCTDNTPKPPTTQSNPSPTGAAPRSDGQCGYKFGGSTCEPQGPFCGKTDGHCLVSNGCQNGCRDGNPAAPIVPTSLTTQSSTSGEPVIGQVKTSMAAEATATARVTTDGTCGGSKGNTVCGNWVNGNCCSMYGFCGKTSAHCGAGCQSGNCLSSPAVPVAGPRPAPAAPNGGTFRVVGQAGVPAMHAGLMPNGRVIFLDKVENYTQLRLVDGHYAMSAEYDPVANTAVPLEYSTNAFCSGGTFLADGRMISVGGNADLPFIDSNIGNGLNAIRYIGRSSIDAGQNGKSWSEPGNKLASARWYATAQTMPDGTVFVASGSLNGLDPTVTANNNPTYEILNPDGSTRGTNVELGILKKNQPYYMYPFVHLLSDGTLFLFTSKASQVFNVGSNTVAKDLPDLPGDYRTYPNTGGSVLLPLSSKNNWAPDIVICGGGAYQDLTSPTDPSCGRIQPLTANAQWEMDYMPEGRGMVEGTLLPDGTVIWMNGGSRGAQGFGLMDAPATEALLYDPAKPVGQRFSTLARSDVPRLYHSVCLLLLDGTVMVAGSNPVEMPILQPDAAHPYVTEWRVENYVPPYLQGDKANQRPTNIVIESKTVRADGSQMIITLIPPHTSDNVKVVLYHGGFVTHSVHMGHRMLNLDIVRSTRGGPVQTLYVTGPPSRNLAPPGPYVLYVLVDGVPGVGQFVQVV